MNASCSILHDFFAGYTKFLFHWHFLIWKYPSLKGHPFSFNPKLIGSYDSKSYHKWSENKQSPKNSKYFYFILDLNHEKLCDGYQCSLSSSDWYYCNIKNGHAYFFILSVNYNRNINSIHLSPTALSLLMSIFRFPLFLTNLINHSY